MKGNQLQRSIKIVPLKEQQLEQNMSSHHSPHPHVFPQLPFPHTTPKINPNKTQNRSLFKEQLFYSYIHPKLKKKPKKEKESERERESYGNGRDVGKREA